MNKPLLLDFAVCRNKNTEKIFQYNYELDMNVLKSNTKQIFITANPDMAMLSTETRVQREADDAEYGYSELLTKTEQGREQDDESSYSFAELFSKTYADRERDDEDDFNFN